MDYIPTDFVALARDCHVRALVHVFQNDMSGYNRWSDAHQHGYIAATCTCDTPQPFHTVIHHATCPTIRQDGREYTANFKACANTRQALIDWIALQQGIEPGSAGPAALLDYLLSCWRRRYCWAWNGGIR